MASARTLALTTFSPRRVTTLQSSSRAWTVVPIHRSGHAESSLMKSTESQEAVVKTELRRLRGLEFRYKSRSWYYAREVLQIQSSLHECNSRLLKGRGRELGWLYDKLKQHQRMMNALELVCAHSPWAKIRRWGITMHSLGNWLHDDIEDQPILEGLRESITVPSLTMLTLIRFKQWRVVQPINPAYNSATTTMTFIDVYLDEPNSYIPYHLMKAMKMFLATQRTLLEALEATRIRLLHCGVLELYPSGSGACLTRQLQVWPKLGRICRSLERKTRNWITHDETLRLYEGRARRKTPEIFTCLKEMTELNDHVLVHLREDITPLLSRYLDICSPAELERREMLLRQLSIRLWRIDHESGKEQDYLRQKLAEIRLKRNVARGWEMLRQKQQEEKFLPEKREKEKQDWKMNPRNSKVFRRVKITQRKLKN